MMRAAVKFFGVLSLGIGGCMLAAADVSSPEIESLRSMCDSLNCVKDSLTKVADALESEHNFLSDSLTNLKLKTDSIKKNFKALEAQKSGEISQLNADITSLDGEIAANSVAIKQRVEDAKKLEASVAKESADLQAYLVGYVPILAKEYIDYTRQHFSQIDINTLNAYLEEANKYADYPDMLGAIDALNKAIELRLLVTAGFELLDKPFGPQISEARDGLAKAKKMFSAEQWQEVYDTLDAYLSRYKNGKAFFVELIEKVEEICNNDKLDSTAKSEAIKKAFDEQAQKEERYYSNIPYLGKRYQKLRNIFFSATPERAVTHPVFISVKSDLSTPTN